MKWAIDKMDRYVIEDKKPRLQKFPELVVEKSYRKW